ncbi:gamma carbonic anhydrase family protein [Desulfonema magnum]|uniref:Carbonic anhydrase family protein n=1 Tax=Desulfonema magnum TaxID=45655 RepID=A0A975BMJ6_9BACT|nr:gamma carbonic anhydrase family protein [Desulfonema magnum]QTA88297.1 Carbonic anhydrase family protein [Desulfonema magnum]
MILEHKGKKPKIGKNVFIALTATVIGDVEIEDGASVWYGAVLRGDMAPVKVGKNTNIQDNCTVHTDTDKPAVIGDNVTIGHNAVVHGCTVERNCLIGINAVVLNDAHVKTGSVVASGSVVKEGQHVGPCHLVAGIPASMKREVTEADAEEFGRPVRDYLRLAREHMDIRRVDE